MKQLERPYNFESTIWKSMFGRLLRRKQIIILILLINFTQSFSQSNLYDVSGLWKSKTDSIKIYQIGQKNNEYLVSIKYSLMPFTFNKNKDSLIFQNGEGKTKNNLYLLYDKEKNIIWDMQELSGKKQYFKLIDSKFTACNLKNIKASANSFFNFSTTEFCAGNTICYGPKVFLPFMPNSEFIKSKSIDTIKIALFNKYISYNRTSKTKEYDLTYIFDTLGNIIYFNAVHYSISDAKTIFTTNSLYRYANKKLQKIYIKTFDSVKSEMILDTLVFDTDGWTINHFGQKESRSFMHQILAFTYNNSSNLPLISVFKCVPGKDQPYITYKYNIKNQLVNIFYHEPTTKRQQFVEYEYDKNGVLKTIINFTKDTD